MKGRKFVTAMLLMVASAIYFIAMVARASEGEAGAVEGDVTSQAINVASVLVGMAIPYIFSLLANAVETKPTDGPWVKFWKGVLTKVLAGNYSKKAGL